MKVENEFPGDGARILAQAIDGHVTFEFLLREFERNPMRPHSIDAGRIVESSLAVLTIDIIELGRFYHAALETAPEP